MLETVEQARAAERLGKECARRSRGSRFEGGRVVREVPLEAFMNAVDGNGREVASREGDEFWRDMDRRHPEIRRDGVSGARVEPMRNRFGRVSFRKRYAGESRRGRVRGEE